MIKLNIPLEDKVKQFSNVEDFIASEIHDFHVNQNIKGLGLINDITDGQVKINDTWFDKRGVVPIEKLSASRIKNILQKPIREVKASDIQYLKQIEKKVFKPMALRGENLNNVIKKLTGKSLRDDANFANNVLYTIEHFYAFRRKQLKDIYHQVKNCELEKRTKKQKTFSDRIHQIKNRKKISKDKNQELER